MEHKELFFTLCKKIIKKCFKRIAYCHRERDLFKDEINYYLKLYTFDLSLNLRHITMYIYVSLIDDILKQIIGGIMAIWITEE